jgi:ElaB/YqjD/DUF883 family membrane-anchored ribosome-binding protein
MNSPTTTVAENGTTQRRVEGAIRTTQQAAHEAVDQVADRADRLAADTDRLAQRSAHLLRDSTEQIRERARHAADSTIVHIRQDPLKSVLIAGAFGAVLGALFVMMGRTRH